MSSIPNYLMGGNGGKSVLQTVKAVDLCLTESISVLLVSKQVTFPTLICFSTCAMHCRGMWGIALLTSKRVSLFWYCYVSGLSEESPVQGRNLRDVLSQVFGERSQGNSASWMLQHGEFLLSYLKWVFSLGSDVILANCCPKFNSLLSFPGSWIGIVSLQVCNFMLCIFKRFIEPFSTRNCVKFSHKNFMLFLPKPYEVDTIFISISQMKKVKFKQSK